MIPDASFCRQLATAGSETVFYISMCAVMCIFVV